MKVFHNQDIKQINFLDERFYTDGKNYYPSVTYVLDAMAKGYGFNEWLKREGVNADEILRKAGEQGSKIHTAIDEFFQGYEITWKNEQTGRENFTLEEWQMLMRFYNFYETFAPEIIHNELILFSDTYKIGGTADLICKINGETWLIDYKSSNYLHKSYDLQVSAYAMMFVEKYKIKIDKAGILHLKSQTRGQDKTGKVIQGEGWILKETFKPYKEVFEYFKAVRMMWDLENPNPKPKNMLYPDRFSLPESNFEKDLL